MAFFPGLQPREDRSVVGLISIGDDAVAADCLVRLDGVYLAENALDLLQGFAGAFERSCRRQLDVDAEDALVFIGNKSGGNAGGKEAGAQNYEGHNADRQDAL